MVQKNKYATGDILTTPNYGDIEIIEYVNCKNVTIKFVNTGYIVEKQQLGNIVNGNLKDKFAPSVYNVGITGEEVCSIEGKKLKEYVVWTEMLRRCYCEDFKNKYPTYIDCEASDNFKYFSYFKNWCNNQVGFNESDFELDKDILLKGNKIYSESLCVFVPKEINTLFTKRNSKRGENVIGVTCRTKYNNFIVNLSIKGKKVTGKVFNKEEEAFLFYKETKEAYIKELAEKWKDKIDKRVYQSLLTYEVSIND